ncbi:hypothetical protein L6164_015170 [Bauhinia variegata]|uniref:Uncharacterized protein n=1 Tax=Bauhinia variegata TaxID=167791 RepID=A0ACB9NJW2_BAUVA|nr:hypothetical protein L6164_015170 [Bauhinia variegata]
MIVRDCSRIPTGHYGIENVDATLQQQHATSLEKDQNGGSLREANDHKSTKSPTHSHREEYQFMVDDADDSNSPDNNVSNYSSPSLMPETRSTGDKTYNQNQLKDARSHSHEELLIPKAKEKNLREMKNVPDDTQMTGERAMEFKPPKFYGEPLNCLKAVGCGELSLNWVDMICGDGNACFLFHGCVDTLIDAAAASLSNFKALNLVTASKLWRQIGESFHPLKTCTTVSWTFRSFYEKALLEFEKHKREIGELQLPVGSFRQSLSVEKETSIYQTPGSGNDEVAEPIIKEKNINYTPKREKNLKSIGVINEQKTLPVLEHAERNANIDGDKQLRLLVIYVNRPLLYWCPVLGVHQWLVLNCETLVVDWGSRDQYAGNFLAQKDCFEVYALVPGLLREEVRVQSDPAERLVIIGQPEHVDNPWGITPFKKDVWLPGCELAWKD